MGGALRYPARAGDGVAWLPKSLAQSDQALQLFKRASPNGSSIFSISL
jgi:hypothetical protein